MTTPTPAPRRTASRKITIGTVAAAGSSLLVAAILSGGLTGANWSDKEILGDAELRSSSKVDLTATSDTTWMGDMSPEAGQDTFSGSFSPYPGNEIRRVWEGTASAVQAGLVSASFGTAAFDIKDAGGNTIGGTNWDDVFGTSMKVTLDGIEYADGDPATPGVQFDLPGDVSGAPLVVTVDGAYPFEAGNETQGQAVHLAFGELNLYQSGTSESGGAGDYSALMSMSTTIAGDGTYDANYSGGVAGAPVIVWALNTDTWDWGSATRFDEVLDGSGAGSVNLASLTPGNYEVGIAYYGPEAEADWVSFVNAGIRGTASVTVSGAGGGDSEIAWSSVQITSPIDGSTFPMMSALTVQGTGAPGATLSVSLKSGSNGPGGTSAVVGEDGTWTTTFSSDETWYTNWVLTASYVDSGVPSEFADPAVFNLTAN